MSEKRRGIHFQRTDGNYHTNRKLDEFQAMVIRAEYDSGKRGKANAWRWKISGAHYNRIGRREWWVKRKNLPDWG